MSCCGIRGATCTRANTPNDIVGEARRLLEAIIAANGVSTKDVASVIFSATADLDAAYPARAAREIGWTEVPLLCLQEMTVTDSLPRCIRVLIHWNTHRAQDEIQHVYLGAARTLRPDLAQPVGKEDS